MQNIINPPNWLGHDPENVKLLDFVAKKSMETATPFNISNICREFNEATGGTKAYKNLSSKLQRYRPRLHELEGLDVETKVRMIFLLGAPVDKGFLKEMKKQADIVVDQRGRITSYSKRGGGLTLCGTHSGSIAQQNSKREENMLEFLALKTEVIDTPVTDVSFIRDYKEYKNESRSETHLTRIYQLLKSQIFEHTDYDLATRIKMMIVSSAKITKNILNELQKDAIVVVDNEHRITGYYSNDGTLELEVNHSKIAKLRNQEKEIRRRAGISNFYGNVCSFVPKEIFSVDSRKQEDIHHCDHVCDQYFEDQENYSESNCRKRSKKICGKQYWDQHWDEIKGSEKAMKAFVKHEIVQEFVEVEPDSPWAYLPDKSEQCDYEEYKIQNDLTSSKCVFQPIKLVQKPYVPRYYDVPQEYKYFPLNDDSFPSFAPLKELPEQKPAYLLETNYPLAYSSSRCSLVKSNPITNCEKQINYSTDHYNEFKNMENVDFEISGEDLFAPDSPSSLYSVNDDNFTDDSISIIDFLKMLRNVILAIDKQKSLGFDHELDNYMRKFENRELEVPLQEALLALKFTENAIIKKDTLEGTVENSIKLQDFLLILRDAVSELNLPGFADYLKNLEKIRKETADKRVTFENIRLVLDFGIQIVLPLQ